MFDRKNVVAILAVVLLLASSSLAAEPIEDLLSQAREAYFAGSYYQAESLFKELLDREAYEWDAHFYLGMTYLHKEQLEEAEHHMDQAYAMNPDNFFTLVNYARILYRQGHLQEADAMLNLVPEEKRTTSESYFNNRGLLAMAEEEYEQAVEYFLKAVEINPENYYVQNNLGLALIRKGDFEKASHHLELAAAQDPPEAYIYNNLGVAYENMNQLEAARENYERAVELNPQHAQINLDRVISRLED